MKKFRHLPVLGFIAIVASGAAGAEARQLAQTPPDMIWCHDERISLLTRKWARDCKHRVVDDETAERIRAERVRRIKRKLKGQDPLVPGRRLSGSGSGFFVNTAGYLLTNHHVIAKCHTVSVTPAAGSAMVATVIASDKAADLALLQAPFAPPGIAVFREARSPLPGDGVAVVGYPLHLKIRIKPFMATGHVYVGDARRRSDRFSLKIDIRKGNSGSPVIDESGLVIGVVTADLNTPRLYKETGKLIRNVGIAVGLPPVIGFLRRHQVVFAVGSYGKTLSDADLFARARAYVARISCWK